MHAGLVALGLGAIVAASGAAYTVIKIAGAAYLVVLGAVSLLRAVRRRPHSRPEAQPGDQPTHPAHVAAYPALSWLKAYRQGLLCNVLNPKAVLTYTTADTCKFIAVSSPASSGPGPHRAHAISSTGPRGAHPRQNPCATGAPSAPGTSHGVARSWRSGAVPGATPHTARRRARGVQVRWSAARSPAPPAGPPRPAGVGALDWAGSVWRRCP